MDLLNNCKGSYLSESVSSDEEAGTSSFLQRFTDVMNVCVIDRQSASEVIASVERTWAMLTDTKRIKRNIVFSAALFALLLSCCKNPDQMFISNRINSFKRYSNLQDKIGADLANQGFFVKATQSVSHDGRKMENLSTEQDDDKLNMLCFYCNKSITYLRNENDNTFMRLFRRHRLEKYQCAVVRLLSLQIKLDFNNYIFDDHISSWQSILSSLNWTKNQFSLELSKKKYLEFIVAVRWQFNKQKHQLSQTIYYGNTFSKLQTSTPRSRYA